MFPLIGVGEVVMAVADAGVLALILLRWKFNALFTFLAWLGITVAVMIVYVPMMRMAFSRGASRSAAPIVGVTLLVVFLGARLVALRLMSKAHTFRDASQPPLGWGWIIALPLCSLFLGLVIGGFAQNMAGGI
jgi:hypothetical protein